MSGRTRTTSPRTIDVVAIALGLATSFAAAASDEVLVRAGRLGFVVLTIWAFVRVMQDRWMRLPALCCLVLLAAGRFADELSTLGVPGIWFPFGIGVSRTQFLYAIGVPLLGFLLVSSTSPSASRRRSTATGPAAEAR